MTDLELYHAIMKHFEKTVDFSSSIPKLKKVVATK